LPSPAIRSQVVRILARFLDIAAVAAFLFITQMPETGSGPCPRSTDA
jgi:hypothetical protein